MFFLDKAVELKEEAVATAQTVEEKAMVATQAVEGKIYFCNIFHIQAIIFLLIKSR
ncbi:MAG: hypothetical protein IT212_13235 [Bacteroidia bacterium]|nr:hypothetical protein [Bacteroidia bacterium]